jgi:DNA-binding transcriptional ArsR family regulator
VPADQLSFTFAALADPTRRSILTRLAEGEATVNELAEPFSVSLPAISRHLKVLERAGLIVRGREAQWRPSRLQADPLNEAVEWMLSRKATWEARMDRLETHLHRTGEQYARTDPREHDIGAVGARQAILHRVVDG